MYYTTKTTKTTIITNFSRKNKTQFGLRTNIDSNNTAKLRLSINHDNLMHQSFLFLSSSRVQQEDFNHVRQYDIVQNSFGDDTKQNDKFDDYIKLF